MFRVLIQSEQLPVEILMFASHCGHRAHGEPLCHIASVRLSSLSVSLTTRPRCTGMRPLDEIQAPEPLTEMSEETTTEVVSSFLAADWL